MRPHALDGLGEGVYFSLVCRSSCVCLEKGPTADIATSSRSCAGYRILPSMDDNTFCVPPNELLSWCDLVACAALDVSCRNVSELLLLRVR